MRLILLGPPGCGKGTQAKLLHDRKGVSHISTGNLLRAARKAGSPVGQEARQYMDAGKLVPDAIVDQVVRELFVKPDRPDSFLMDGYPRSVPQALAFDRLLREVKLPLDAVVLIDLGDDEIIRRIIGRLTCSNPACAHTFHLCNKPPRAADRCDDCGAPLGQRADDRIEAVKVRLEEYRHQTEALGPHYQDLGLLVKVPGTGSVEAIYGKIIQAIESR